MWRSVSDLHVFIFSRKMQVFLIFCHLITNSSSAGSNFFVSRYTWHSWSVIWWSRLGNSSPEDHSQQIDLLTHHCELRCTRTPFNHYCELRCTRTPFNHTWHAKAWTVSTTNQKLKILVTAPKSECPSRRNPKARTGHFGQSGEKVWTRLNDPFWIQLSGIKVSKHGYLQNQFHPKS